MSISRKLLSVYRRFQYFVFGRQKYGVLESGQQVIVEPFLYEINHGDVVHPCVRYISEGFEGHKWWMVYTPYYSSNAALENPILCYAEETDPSTPPTEWKVYCLVNEKPLDGYNSDPALLFDDGQLFVFWRENIVSNKEKYDYWRASFCAHVKDGRVEKCSYKPVVQTDDDEIDAETCPTFIKEADGTYTCYGMHLQFHSKKLKKLSQPIRKIVDCIMLISDLLGVYSQQKHFGIAIWKGKEIYEPFNYLKTVKFHNCNKLYRPWHMDFFDYEGKRYAIVQTNMSNADICLAISDDGENFTFFKKPLITNATIGKLGIYKPCAGVTTDGLFYLYYTAQDVENRSLNKLYLTEMSFNKLLAEIQ